MGRWVIVNNNNVVDNVIVADLTFVDTVMRPQGFVCNEVAEDVRVAPGFKYVSGNYIEPTSCELSVSGELVCGKDLIFTAKILPWGTGNVKLLCDGYEIGDTELSQHQAVYTVNNLDAGTHELKAVFAGSGSLEGCESNVVTCNINKISTSVVLLGPGTSNGSVMLFTSVSPSVSGNVVVKNGSTTLETITLTNGTGSCNLSALAAGEYNFVAEYAGDETHQSSVSEILNHIVE